MKKILTVILSIKGYSDNTFRPDENVSRAEFVAMTVRFNSLFNDVKKGSYTVKYIDVASNYWAYSDIAYAKNVGWLNGYADGSFKGDNAITRAEVVTVVNKATGELLTRDISIKIFRCSINLLTLKTIHIGHFMQYANQLIHILQTRQTTLKLG